MKRGILLSVLFLLSACGSPASSSKNVSKAPEPSKNVRVCSPDTVLAEGKGIKVTLADYRYVEGLLNEKSKRFFSSHPESLLRRMINRRLVIKYLEDSGLAEKYGLDKKMEDFKKDYLSRLYVSKEAEKRVKPVTEEEIVKRFKELFPKKDPSKLSEGDKKFLRNELEVKHYESAVASVYKDVEKKLKFKEEKGTITVSCCGIEVSGKFKSEKDKKQLKERLKGEFFKEYFYRKAVEAGLDKNSEFQRMFTEYFAGKAIEVFRKELEKGIKVSPEEVKAFYEKNKNKFFMPDRAKAVVILVDSKEKAKEAEELLRKGKPWPEVARRFANFTARPKVYYRDVKDPVGTLIFAEGKPEKRKIFVAQFGDKTYAVVYVLEYIPGGVLPFSKVKNYAELVLKKRKLKELEKKKLKELWKKYGVKLENIDCLKGSS